MSTGASLVGGYRGGTERPPRLRVGSTAAAGLLRVPARVVRPPGRGTSQAAEPKKGALKENTPPSEAMSQYPSPAASSSPPMIGRLSEMFPVDP